MADFLGQYFGPLLYEPPSSANPGTPKPPGIYSGAYPATLYNPIGASPSSFAPFERVGNFIPVFGVDPTDARTFSEAENAGALTGDAENINALTPAANVQTLQGIEADSYSSDWFEKWHIFPGVVDLGNVLTSQIFDLEIFSAFRRTVQSWDGFTNNAGAGITITNLPALPRSFEPLESYINNVQVSTSGPPTINGTFDFDVDVDPPDVITVPVTGQRIIIFPYRPQAPIRETLEFKTDVITAADGSEQRIQLRRSPRSRIELAIRTDDDRTRDEINAILFDWQGRVFGVPLWAESKPLEADLAVNDTVISVDTSSADYRVGGLVTIYRDNFYTETLEIIDVQPTSITLQVGVGLAYLAGETLIMPARTAYTKPQANNARYAIGPADYRIEFLTLDNVDLADAGAFPTYQGTGQTVAKPYIDRLNFMPGATIGEGSRRQVVRLDHETGPPLQYSSWTKSKPLYQYGFEAKSQTEVWEFRQLFHALRGSQVAFYVGTGRADFKSVADIADLATAIDIQRIGFTQFYQALAPRADLQLLRTDGTSSRHQITGSSEIDASTERISITPAITPAAPLVEIDRIEFFSICRIADDKVSLEHTRPGESRIDVSLIGVPE